MPSYGFNLDEWKRYIRMVDEYNPIISIIGRCLLKHPIINSFVWLRLGDIGIHGNTIDIHTKKIEYPEYFLSEFRMTAFEMNKPRELNHESRLFDACDIISMENILCFAMTLQQSATTKIPNPLKAFVVPTIIHATWLNLVQDQGVSEEELFKINP